MIKDFKIGDFVKVFGSGFGSLGMISNTIISQATGEITYQVLFPSGERKFIGVIWLSAYEE